MSDRSRLEWTNATWNVSRGCTKISPACKNCYAEAFANRWKGIQGHPFEKGFEFRIYPEKLVEPVKWVKSRRIFVNSMSDLFHEDIPDLFILSVFKVFTLVNWHIYQVLTKRAKRLSSFILKYQDIINLDNVWLGVSCENIEHGVPRISELIKTNPKLRFLSIEPLLENLEEIDLSRIDWLIIGGETGPKARKMEEKWVYNIIEQCKKTNTQFYFQQWGSKNRARRNYKIGDDEFRELPPLEIEKIAPDRKTREIIRNKINEIVEETKMI